MIATAPFRWLPILGTWLAIAGCGSDPLTPPPGVNDATPEPMYAATTGNIDSATLAETAAGADGTTAVDLVIPADGGAPDSAAAPADGATGPANLARFVGLWSYLCG